MKILVVSQYFWPEYFRINELCECLRNIGHEIDVITGIPNYPQGKYYPGYGIFKNKKQNYKGINVYRVPIIPRRQDGGDKRLIPNYLSYAITASIKIAFKIFHKYDAVLVYEVSPITQVYPALLFRWLTKTPVCLYVLDLWPETLFSHGFCKKSTVKKIMYSFIHSIYKRCDKIFISSKGFEKSILSSGYNSERIHYVPNWSEDFYKPVDNHKTDLREELNLDESCFVIMYAGNIGFAQSFETVLEASKILKENKDIHFVIIGEGSLKQWAIDETIKNGQSNISFIGRKPAEEMPEYFAQANAMLVTLKKRENYSLTLPSRVQSYLACGKPLLGCAGDEVSRVINESGAGLSCEPEDAKSLAAMIDQMKQMQPEEIMGMSINAITYSQKEFCKDKLLNGINSLLVEMAETRTRKRVI